MFCFAEESSPGTKDVEKEGEKVTNILQKLEIFSKFSFQEALKSEPNNDIDNGKPILKNNSEP